MPQVTSAEDFGALVRERRRERGLSQQQLAAKVGVSRQWIVQVESGKPRAEVGLMLRVLNALDLVLRVEPRAEDSILDLVERLRGER
ncbi:MAG: helix-turn-helix domain-containing protein [Sandaracinaceae bacterium]